MADSTQQVLADLARAMEDDSLRRKNAISAASANMTRGRMDQTAQDEVALGRQPVYQPGGSTPMPEGPRELGIRSAALRSGTPNGDSTDELMNYALLQRARRMGGQSSAPRVDLAAAEQRAAADVRAPQEGPGARDMSPSRIGQPEFNIDGVANPYGQSQGSQQGYRPIGGAAPAPDPAKERQLSEIDRAAEKAIADMNAIPATAPGAKQALAQSLEERVKSIASALATPSSAVDQSFAGHQAVPAPMPSAPMARFPAIPTPNYPPPAAYPVPPQANTAGLDQAALQEFIRAQRGGMGGM